MLVRQWQWKKEPEKFCAFGITKTRAGKQPTCLARRGRHVVVAASRGTPDSDGRGCKLCSHSRGGARALHCQHGPSGSGSPRLTSYLLCAGWLARFFGYPRRLCLWLDSFFSSFFLSWERTFDCLYLPAKLLSSEIAHFIFASATCACCALSEVVKKPALTRLLYVRGWKMSVGPRASQRQGVFFLCGCFHDLTKSSRSFDKKRSTRLPCMTYEFFMLVSGSGIKHRCQYTQSSLFTNTLREILNVNFMTNK